MTDSAILLLDTHIWLWWIDQDQRLSQNISEFIATFNGHLAVSSASVYEVSILAKRKRISLGIDINDWLDRASQGVGIEILPVDNSIARQAALLPFHHGDPLDRMIIATAVHHQALLASIDAQFPAYEILQGKLLTGR